MKENNFAENYKQPLEDFYSELEDMKIKLWLDNGSLRYKAPKGVITRELLKKIGGRKEELIAYLNAQDDRNILYSEITPAPEKEYYPLSAGQKRMFVLNQLDRKSTAYNTTLALKIEGELDKSRLTDVIKQLAIRHESLRTTFEMVNGKPVQKIHDDVDFVLDCEVLEGDEDNIESVIKDFVRPYDLSRLPLFRVKLVKLNTPGKDDLHYFLFDIHHITSDGVSAAIIIKELNALYEGQTLPELKIQYKDYAAWHEKLLSSGLMQKQKDFWLKQMEGELPVLDLPFDYQRPLKFNTDGESIHYQADIELANKLNGMAHQNRVTLFTVLISAYYVLLSKYSGQSDIIVATPVAGRVHEDTNGVVGLFLNTVPLRNYPEPEKTFADFLKEVGKNCIKAFDNQDYPFDRLVEDLNIQRDTSRNPVFSAMFVMQNMDTDEVKMQGTRITNYNIKDKMAQVDITVNVTENKDGIDFEFNYCTHLFKHGSMERFINHFANILKFAVGHQQAKLSKIDMLSKEESSQIINGFNDTKREYESVTLHALFEEQAARTPDNIAVVLGDKQLSYRELNEKSNKLARTLCEKGTKPDEIIGVLTEPSLEMIVAILGILKAGAAYLPINTDYPEERIRYMLESSGCAVILTQKSLASKIKSDIEILDLNDSSLYADDGSNLGIKCNLDNLAYVIFTSGTTGNPKGVLIEHKSISKTLQWRAGEYKLSGSDSVLQLFSYSFDGFLTSFFTPIISGAKVVLLGKNMEKDPTAVKKQIIAHKVTHFICVPVLYSAILGCMEPEEMKSLRIVTLAGDKASAQLIRKSTQKNPNLELVNEYGPTESSVVATIYRGIKENTNTIIGKPAANTKIYILDKSGMLQPVGVPGELCISGGRLAREYLGRPDLTKQKFVENPYNPGERMYKTGDMAKWLPDGNIVFIGRVDFQVKIRGYRVEPAEIEAELLKHEAVKESVVLDRVDSAQNKYLCAYVVPKRDFTILELRNFLSQDLPEYMIPAKFVKMEKIPLTTNGKVDRKALPEPEENIDMGIEYVEPTNKIETDLAKVWEEVLGIKNIGVNHNFFEIGGDSMSIINLHAKLDKLYPGILTVTDLFSYSTISKLAAFIKKNQKSDVEDENKVNKPKAFDEKNTGDIAIIGISVDLPLAKNTDELWNNIKNKVDCVMEMPESRRRDADAIVRSRKKDINDIEYDQLAYLDEIDKFDCNFFRITPKEANLMDPNQRLFLQTAWGAIENAGYGGDKLKGTRTGVYVGFCGESEYGKFIADVQPQSYSIAASGNLTSFIGSRISYILDLKGPSVVVNTACSSSLVAIHYACRGIKNGECDMAIAGGVKLWLNSVKNEFKMGIESDDARTKSFDDDSNGTAKGEGVAAILLKPLEKALKDNDSIYAVIKGGFINQDGASNGITAPSPTAQADVISMAWEDAKINPETIGYIEAHGTGTKLGDPIEIDGLQKAFRKYTAKKQFCAISSIKSNMGHLDNAAGVVGVVKAALALKNRELPATMHFETPNRAIDFVNSPVYVNDRTQKWVADTFPRRCGVSAFGLSGTNCHLVLEEAPEYTRDVSEKSKLNILTVSAKTKQSLLELIDLYIEKYSEEICDEDYEDLCYTLNTGRGHYSFRAAIVIVRGESLPEKLNILKNQIKCENNSQNVFYAEHKVTATGSGSAEITQNEKENYSGKACAKVKEFVNGGKQDSKLLYDICSLYVMGADVDWETLYKGENVRRVHAPTYPFLKQRCWIDLPATKKEPKINMYYALHWNKKAIESKTSSLSQKNVLVLSDEQGIFNDFVNGLENKSKTLTKVVKGSEFRKIDEFNYVIDGSEEDYDKLCECIKQNGINTVVYLLSVTGSREINYVGELQKIQDTGAMGLVYFIKAYDKVLKDNIELDIVSDNVNEVTGGESRINPENSVTFGIGKSIAAEFTNIHCRLIDIDEKIGADKLLEEVEKGTDDYQVAYRGGVRYIDELKKVEAETLADSKVEIASEGVYLITGGTGRLALGAAKDLASKGKVNLALVNRTPMPDKSSWDGILEENNNEKVCNIIKAVRDMEKSGANVICCSCDITSEDELKTLLSALRGKFGRINGIIHCAAVGVGNVGNLINQETSERFKKVLMPKVQGTWLLDKLTRQDRPDFFVMYSSSITLIGGYCSSSYTAANSYLDSYAAARSKSGLKTLTVDWPVWENDNLKNGIDDKSMMFRILTMKKGIDSLNEMLNKNISRVIVGEMNFESEILSLEGQLPFRLSEDLKAEVVKKSDAGHKPAIKEETLAYDKEIDVTGEDTEKIIAKLFAGVLGFETVNLDDDFFDLGGHSLLAVEFITKLSQVFHKNITLQCLYDNPTVRELTEIFREDTTETQDADFEEFEL